MNEVRERIMNDVINSRLCVWDYETPSLQLHGAWEKPEELQGSIEDTKLILDGREYRGLMIDFDQVTEANVENDGTERAWTIVFKDGGKLYLLADN